MSLVRDKKQHQTVSKNLVGHKLDFLSEILTEELQSLVFEQCDFQNRDISKPEETFGFLRNSDARDKSVKSSVAYASTSVKVVVENVTLKNHHKSYAMIIV